MYKMLAEFPFDSDVKKMSVLYKNINTDEMYAYTKGAVERVVTSCTSYFADASEKPVTLARACCSHSASHEPLKPV